jgi:trigger factor
VERNLTLLNLIEEKIGPCLLSVQVEVEKERVDSALKQAAAQLARQVRIPGFRAGKAPYHIVVNTLGKENVLSKAVETLGNEMLKEITEQRGLQLYNEPQLEVAQSEPLKLKYTIVTQPQIDLGNYRALRIEAKPLDPVTDEQVNKAIEDIRRHHATHIPVDHAVEIGNAVRIDMKAETTDKVWFERKDLEREVVTGERDFAPGFSEQLVSMNAGETRTFDLPIPADFSNADLAGKILKCVVTVHDVREIELPPLDDELAKIAGDHETLDELRAQVRQNLEESAKNREETRFGSEALQKAIDGATIEMPDAMVEHEVMHELEGMMQNVQKEGFEFERWLQMNQTSVAALRAQLRPGAEARLKQSLFLYNLAQREGIKVAEEDLDEAIGEEVELYPTDLQDQVRQMYAKDDARLSIALRLAQQKALDKLIAIVKGEGVLLPSDVTAQPAQQVLVASA